MSDDRFTPTDLAELKAAEAAASPGPWAIESCGEKGDGAEIIGIVYGPDDPECQKPLSGRVYDCDLDGNEIELYRDETVCYCEHRDENPAANAQFIALSRTAVPQLIGEVEQLRADKAALIEALQPFAKRSFDSLDFARAATVVQRVKGER